MYASVLVCVCVCVECCVAPVPLKPSSAQLDPWPVCLRERERDERSSPRRNTLYRRRCRITGNKIRRKVSRRTSTSSRDFPKPTRTERDPQRSPGTDGQRIKEPLPGSDRHSNVRRVVPRSGPGPPDCTLLLIWGLFCIGSAAAEAPRRDG